MTIITNIYVISSADARSGKPQDEWFQALISLPGHILVDS